MAHSPQRARLRAAYVGGMSFEAAAKSLAISDSTAREWCQKALARGDDWKAARAAPATAALERIDAKLAELLALEGLPEGFTFAGDGAVETESDRRLLACLDRGLSMLRRELRCGFAVLIIAAAIGGFLAVLR